MGNLGRITRKVRPQSPASKGSRGFAFDHSHGNKPDKGKENGSCNRTACQRPLAHEPTHQFMDGNFTGGPRLYYCAPCAHDFDHWDRIDSPLQPRRIKREPKAAAHEGGAPE